MMTRDPSRLDVAGLIIKRRATLITMLGDEDFARIMKRAKEKIAGEMSALEIANPLDAVMHLIERNADLSAVTKSCLIVAAAEMG